MEKPKFSVGWCIFWALFFFPAIAVQALLYFSKMKEYELWLAEQKTKRK
jgi:hypothetical protein